jgi:hypothetical protein
MPSIFGDIHDSFIENYLNTLVPRILNRERFILGLTKTGYMFIFNVHVRYIASFLHGN